jgi:hypothetical protein
VRTVSTLVATALVAAALLLSACPAAPAKTSKNPDPDRQRIAVMHDEPLVARDGTPSINQGFVISDKLPAHRNMISAGLLDEDAQNADEVARKQTSDAMMALRENKWVIYLAGCLAPGPDNSDNKDDVLGFQHEDGWAFAAYAYKIADGVSYSAELLGSASGKRARLSLRLLAPHSSEPRADVFPDRPPALEAGKSCIETSLPPQARSVTGVPTVMDSVGPHPTGGPQLANRR